MVWWGESYGQPRHRTVDLSGDVARPGAGVPYDRDMLTRSTTRRIGAALTAALVSVLLVTFGGSARTPASAQRTTAGPTDSSPVLHAPRLLQHVVANPHD